MKIVYYNSPFYDYMDYALMEGFNNLGLNVIFRFPGCGQQLNFSSNDIDGNILLVGTNKAIPFHELQGAKPKLFILIDGSDDSHIRFPPLELSVDVVFKREFFLTGRYSEKIFPLPLCAESRYFDGLVPWQGKDVDVLFIGNVFGNPQRATLMNLIRNAGRDRWVAGNTGERAYNPAAPSFHPIPTPRYDSLTRRSKIVLAVPGNGYDTARFWEGLAAGALLVTPRLDLKLPGIVPGEHYVQLDDIYQVVDLLDSLLEKETVIRDIAASGFELISREHRAIDRAKSLIHFIESNI